MRHLARERISFGFFSYGLHVTSYTTLLKLEAWIFYEAVSLHTFYWFFLFFCLSLNSTKFIISYVFILKPLTNLKDHLIEAKKGKQIRMIGCFSLTYCMGILLGPRLVLK